MAGNVKTVTIEIDVKTGSITKGREEFDKLNSTVNKGSKDMTSSMSKLSTSIVGIGASMVSAFAIKAVIGNAINIIKQFDQAMADLGAITGTSGKELEKFKTQVLNVSKETGKSASDIAKAFQIVGSAQPELLKSAAALGEVTKQSVLLSQAGGLEVPEAANALTLAMNQFGASAADAASFTNILATSQQKGTATIAQLAESLKNVGAVASSAGVSFEDTNVALQALAKGGLVGAEAGTGLRSVILKLQSAGIGFVDGQFNMQEAIKQTKEKFDNIKDPIERVKVGTKLFGEENIKVANTLVAQVGVIGDLTGALNENGAALDQANTRMNTITGRNEKMSAAYDRYILSLEDGQGALGDAIASLQEFATSILETSELDEKISKLGLSRGLFQDYDIATESVIRFNNALEKQVTAFSLSNPSVEQQKELLRKLYEEMNNTNRSTEEGNAKYLILRNTIMGLGDGLKQSTTSTKDATDATDENTTSTDKNNKSKEKQLTLLEAQKKLQADFKKELEGSRGIQDEIVTDEQELADKALFDFISREEAKNAALEESLQTERDIKAENRLAEFDAFMSDEEARLEFQQKVAESKQQINQQLMFGALGLASALANAAGGSMSAQMAALVFEKTAAAASVIISTQVANAKALALFGTPLLAAPSIIANKTLGAIQLATILATAIPQAAAIQKPKFKDGVIDLQGKGTATSDSIPAMLSKGESVMTARETQEHKPVLKAIREGNFDEYLNRVIVQQLYTHKTKERVKVKEVKQAQINFPKGFKVTNARDINQPMIDAIKEQNFLNQNGSWQ